MRSRHFERPSSAKCRSVNQRALGHSRQLKGASALWHSEHLGIWDTRVLEGRLGTRILEAIGHSKGALALGTRRTLEHSNTQALEALYLANSHTIFVSKFDLFFHQLKKKRHVIK